VRQLHAVQDCKLQNSWMLCRAGCERAACCVLALLHMIAQAAAAMASPVLARVYDTSGDCDERLSRGYEICLHIREREG
jgi:hypothetical protein